MSSKSSILECVRAGKPISHTPVIDLHSHLAGSSEYYYIPYHRNDDVIRYMDRFGVDHLLSFAIATTTDPRPGNHYQYQASKTYPQRFSALTMLHAGFPQDWIELLEDGWRNGSRGVKLISQYQGVDENTIDWSPIFEYARDKNWIALHHGWGGVERLERWAKEFPEIVFIVGHATTGYKDVVNKYDNVYQNTSALFAFELSIENLLNEMDVEKIIHGSDALDLDLGTSIGPIAYADISEDAKEKIFGLNALNIMKKLKWDIDLTKGS